MNTFPTAGRYSAWPKWFRTLIVACLFLLSGGAVGIMITIFWQNQQSSGIEDRRASKTTSVLDRMQSISIGDTLIDTELEDLTGSKVQLSHFIKKLTWVGIIEPGCDACDNTIEDLRSSVPSLRFESSFLFISAANPRILQDLRDQEGIVAPILYDHRRQWLHSINLTTFPFFLLVDSNLQIRQAVAGGLSPVHAIKSIEANEMVEAR